MKRLALLILCLFVLPFAAAAAQEAATGPAEPPQKPVTHVLVLGDGIGGGLGAGLTRVSDPTGLYDVQIRFNEESGLARPEVYDWPATAAKILASNSYEVIVVMLGANDTQAIRTGGQRIAFGDEGWAEAYGAQVDRLLDQLKPSNARIIWTATPPVRDPEYDAALKQIAEIQRQRVEAKGFTFFDMRKDLSAPDGSFTDTGPDDTGTVTRLRGRDGVSFYKAGNNRMGQLLLAALETGGGGTEAGQTDGRTDLQVQEETPQLPIFGQTLMNGEIYAVQPEGVTANAVMLAGAGLDPQASLKALRELSPPDSNAILLFRYGHVPAAPAGRPDDFSLPPEPATQ
jgi:hypothetical protein